MNKIQTAREVTFLRSIQRSVKLRADVCAVCRRPWHVWPLTSGTLSTFCFSCTWTVHRGGFTVKRLQTSRTQRGPLSQAGGGVVTWGWRCFSFVDESRWNMLNVWNVLNSPASVRWLGVWSAGRAAGLGGFRGSLYELWPVSFVLNVGSKMMIYRLGDVFTRLTSHSTFILLLPSGWRSFVSDSLCSNPWLFL